MVSTSTVVKLISAFKEGDKSKIDKLIKDIANSADEKGQIKLAQDLRMLYAKPMKQDQKGEQTTSYIPQGLGTSNNRNPNLFERRMSKVDINDIVLSGANRDLLNEIKNNYQKRKMFIAEGIASENKILLYGKPGTGKTLFAYVIAGYLKLPILHVHLDALISSYLGETGKNIRQIFEEARSEECILFIDEFDSIAKKRDDNHELGELKRVVTVLLQNIDNFGVNSVLVVATNHQHLLDEAIWRRFDYQLNLDVLDEEGVKDLLKLYLNKNDDVKIGLLSFLAKGQSGALIKQAIHKALRRKIVDKIKDEKQNINVYLLEELLRLKNLKDLDFKTENDIEVLKEVIDELRKYDEKYYTFKKIEEITGIPDSSLSHYFKKITRK